MKLLNYLFFSMFVSVLESCELTGVCLLLPWLIKWKSGSLFMQSLTTKLAFTRWHGNTFHVIGPLWGEYTNHDFFVETKTHSRLSVMWDATLFVCHCNGQFFCITACSDGTNRTGTPFTEHGITLIPTWIIIHIHYEVWDEITYLFPNFNDATVEVCEWIPW